MKKSAIHIVRLFVIVAFVATLTSSTIAQVVWPAITKQNKPWTRWWWQGSAVDSVNLSKVMDMYAKAGLGGLEITPIYGVRGSEKQFIPYLSAKWVDVFLFTLRKAKQLDIGIDMATGTGWPFGGPWVDENNACKFITWKNYSLAEGQRLSELIRYTQEGFVRTANGKSLPLDQVRFPVSSNENMQDLAIDQVRYNTDLPLKLLMAYNDQGKHLDLTSRVINGKLDWVAPAGNWKLVGLFEGLHGKMVERAAPGGEGNVIDHFQRMALKNYLGKFDSALKGKDISYLRSFFNDSYEVDDARGQSNWTPAFLEEFNKRRGYHLEELLPELISVDTTKIHQQVLHDYRNTISDLLLDNFTRPWYKWAKEKGKLVRNQSHGSPANILDLYSTVDIPETEGINLTRFKFATSAAHVMGKPLASAEASTWLNEHFLTKLSDVKKNIDQYFLGGVNHIFYHGTNYSPLDNNNWPGWLFYAAVDFTPANPFWQDFSKLNQYVSSCQSFLQLGKSSNDVLLYFPFHDRNYEEAKGGLLQHFDGMEGYENSSFNRIAEWMLSNGYGWDLISDRQVQQLNTENGQLKAPGGNYQTIVLSGVQYLPYNSLSKMVELVKKGATVIIHKSLPTLVPGYKDSKDYQELFDSLLQVFKFRSIPNKNVQLAKLGKGKILMGEDYAELLLYAGVRHEIDLATWQIGWVRRTLPGGEYYFLVNNSDKQIADWIILNAEFNSATIYNPMNKYAGLAKFKKNADGKSAVLIQLHPGESCIVQTSKLKAQGKLYPYDDKKTESIQIVGEWKLNFLKGGPELPFDTVIKQLGSWTDLPMENAKEFSGSASYTTNFKKPEGEYDALRIDLGTVHESATIRINGKTEWKLIGPIFTIDIPYTELKPDNSLEVIVTNGMANWIIDLDKKGVEWKRFYNINMPAKLASNRGPDGLFTSRGWKPLASGLMGPVSITPVRYQKK